MRCQPYDPAARMSQPEISVCVPVWKSHRPPNLATLAESLPRALGGLNAELGVVLNGVASDRVGVPTGARVIELDQNIGVPAAWNLAGCAARRPVLCFSNDDVVFGDLALARLRQAVFGPPGSGVLRLLC